MASEKPSSYDAWAMSGARALHTKTNRCKVTRGLHSRKMSCRKGRKKVHHGLREALLRDTLQLSVCWCQRGHGILL